MKIVPRDSITESFEQYARRCGCICMCGGIATSYPERTEVPSPRDPDQTVKFQPVAFDRHRVHCEWTTALAEWRLARDRLLNITGLERYLWTLYELEDAKREQDDDRVERLLLSLDAIWDTMTPDERAQAQERFANKRAS